MKTVGVSLLTALVLLAPASPRAQGPEVQDFNFYNTDLHLVIKALGEVTDADFVFDVPVSGKVTIHVAKRASLEEVLEIILKPLGLSWRTVGNVYHIALKPGERVARDKPGYIQKTFSLQHMAAGEAARLVRKFLRARGVVSVDRPMNRVTITVAPALLPEAENIIKAADVERGRKLISVRVRILELVSLKNFDSNVGLEFHKYNATFAVASRPHISRLGNDRSSFGNSFYNNALTYKFGLLGVDQVQAYLDIRLFGQNVETVAEADVVVLEGKEATVTIIEQVPNEVLNKYEDVGTIIYIKKPSVSTDGFIRFEEINATMARRKDPSRTRIAGNDLVNRTIKTPMTLLNGDTGRVGGLISQTETVREDKIPLLGDIPLLGFLFKRYRHDTIRTELVILVSPNIVEDVPPHGRRTAGISALAAWLVPTTTHVVLDWSEDVPVDNVGVFQYWVYRDLKPIRSIERLAPLADAVSRAASSWVDETPKRRGVTYYYAVIAVDGAGNRQAVSNSPAITIPKR